MDAGTHCRFLVEVPAGKKNHDLHSLVKKATPTAKKKKWQHLPPPPSRAHLREQHKKSEISSNGQPFQKCNTFENISRDGARGAATHACGDRKFECCRGLSALILKNSTKIRLHWGQRYKNTDAENQFSNIESRGTSNH